MGCNIFLPSFPMNKIFIPNEALEFCDTAAFLDPQISQTLSSACKLTEDGARTQDICFFAATLRRYVVLFEAGITCGDCNSRQLSDLATYLRTISL